MRPVAWMVAAGVITWLLAATALSGHAVEIGFGMAGPLAAAVASWVAYERTFRRAPDRLTGVMVTALVLKMVFFGAYVVVLVRVAGLRAEPLVASFGAYFIGLHAIEALSLRRLLWVDGPGPEGGGSEGAAGRKPIAGR